MFKKKISILLGIQILQFFIFTFFTNNYMTKKNQCIYIYIHVYLKIMENTFKNSTVIQCYSFPVSLIRWNR